MTVQRTSFRPRCIHSIQQQGMWRHNLGYTWLDIVLTDYSLPFRSLVHHFSEQERSGILVLCRMTRKVNLYYHFEHKFLIPNTPLLLGRLALFKRHLLIRGHKTLSLKNEHIIFVTVTSIERTSLSLFKGKGHFFWAPFREHLDSQSVTDHKEHKSQWRQLSQHELSHLKRCTALVGIQLTISLRKAYLDSLYII